MNNRELFVAAVRGMTFALMFMTLIALLCSCTSTKYIPVETVHTEYKDNIREVRTTDSVTDTRFVYVKGDTMIDWRDRVKWRDRYIHDSIFIEKSDTIREPYPVEKPLTKWQQIKMDFGGIAMGGLLIALCFVVVWLIKMLKK